MATLYTHSLVGLGLGTLFTSRRKPLLFWVLAGFLPIIPDFDAFSMSPYGSILGHRGYTHSLLFALAVGLVTAGLTFWYFKMRFWPLAGLFSDHGFARHLGRAHQWRLRHSPALAVYRLPLWPVRADPGGGHRL